MTAWRSSTTIPEMLPVEDWEKRVPKLPSVIKRGATSNLGDVFMIRSSSTSKLNLIRQNQMNRARNTIVSAILSNWLKTDTAHKVLKARIVLDILPIHG